MKHTKQVGALIAAWNLFHEKLAIEATQNLAGQDLGLLERCQVVGILTECTGGNLRFKSDDFRSELAMHSAELKSQVEGLDEEVVDIVALALTAVLKPAESIRALRKVAERLRFPLEGIDEALARAESNRAAQAKRQQTAAAH